MAKKGDIARETVKNTIVEAFGAGFAGIADKKIYVNVMDGNEIAQVAISMTIPKTPVFTGGEAAETSAPTPVMVTPTELSTEDRAVVDKLMDRLGITR